LVINDTPTALSYRLRFMAEQSDPSAASLADRPRGAPAAPGGPAAAPATEQAAAPKAAPWKILQTIEVRGGPVSAGASQEATASFGESVLVPGKACRFRAELLEDPSGAVLAEVLVTKEQNRPMLLWMPAAALALATGGGSGNASQVLNGSGTMEGAHQARRVGSQWIEQGQGIIRVTGRDWSMTIDYTYESQGPNAATLVAVAKGTGQAQFVGKPTVPVTITSATAAIGAGGSRQQTGSVVVRTGCTATGTFDGQMGDARYRGVITMTNGTQTLDLATHAGEHRFDIQFTASR
jgi:hypothetical protein